MTKTACWYAQFLQLKALCKAIEMEHFKFNKSAEIMMEKSCSQQLHLQHSVELGYKAREYQQVALA